MTDFLKRLAERTLGTALVAQPIIPARFARGPDMPRREPVISVGEESAAEVQSAFADVDDFPEDLKIEPAAPAETISVPETMPHEPGMSTVERESVAEVDRFERGGSEPAHLAFTETSAVKDDAPSDTSPQPTESAIISDPQPSLSVENRSRMPTESPQAVARWRGEKQDITPPEFRQDAEPISALAESVIDEEMSLAVATDKSEPSVTVSPSSVEPIEPSGRQRRETEPAQSAPQRLPAQALSRTSTPIERPQPVVPRRETQAAERLPSAEIETRATQADPETETPRSQAKPPMLNFPRERPVVAPREATTEISIASMEIAPFGQDPVRAARETIPRQQKSLEAPKGIETSVQPVASNTQANAPEAPQSIAVPVQRALIPHDGPKITGVRRSVESGSVSAFSDNDVVLPSLTVDRRESEPATPTIQVTIGRIEVRANPPPPPTPSTKPERPRPALSLEDYLKRRNGR